MSMRAMSHIYSTFDIANIEGTQVRHLLRSNCCYDTILIGKTASFNGTCVLACRTLCASKNPTNSIPFCVQLH